MKNLIGFVSLLSIVHGCNYLEQSVFNEDGNPTGVQVVQRSMQFEPDFIHAYNKSNPSKFLQSNGDFALLPRNYSSTSLTDIARNATVEVKNKYMWAGIVMGVGALKQMMPGISDEEAENVFASSEVMNEKGLNVHLLEFKDVVWEQPGGKFHNKTLAMEYGKLLVYLVGECENVEDVRNAIQNISIVTMETSIGGGNNIPQAHWAVSDASGNSIVIEVLDGEAKVMENKARVLTNGPRYPWHLENLAAYRGLSSEGVDPNGPVEKMLTEKGIPQMKDQGTNLLGFPGDLSSKSICFSVLHSRAISIDLSAENNRPSHYSSASTGKPSFYSVWIHAKFGQGSNE